MRPRIARVVAVGALLFAAGGVIFGTAAAFTIGDRIEPGTIVVIGDPASPGMQDVLDELRHDVAGGDPLRESLDPTITFYAVIGILVLVWIGVGALIVWRQPGNWAGWLFLITGSTFPLALVASTVVVADLKGGRSFPLTGLFAWAGEFALYPVALLPLLFLLYPDGHPPSPRWRWSVVALVGGTFVAFVGFLLRPGPYNNWRGDGIVYANPLGIDGFTWAGVVIAVGTIVAMTGGVSTAVAVVVRFRRSSGEERQQMRVIAFVAALAGLGVVVTVLVALAGTALGIDEEGSSAVFTILWSLALLTLFVGIPVSYLVAILRYRLWELDLVIKKTLIAVVLTLLLGGIGLVAFAIVGQFAVWEGANPRVSLVVGLVFGALFVPLVRLSRRIAGRIAFGRRASTYEVLTAFSERVGETYSTSDILPRMVRVLASGTGASSARIFLHIGSEVREVARWPEDEDPGSDEHVERVVDHGEELGALAVSMPANDPMNPGKAKLVHDLATQAGLVLRNVKLIEDLRASRARLVAAQDEERRKIERNIHDGVQQQLVSLAVQLRMAEQLVGTDEERQRSVLAGLQGTANTALEELRDLARGIYPPLLADKGLAAALDSQARKAAVPTTVHADGLGRYPREIESAVYFCALEALNNIAKYAGAGSADITLITGDGHLAFTVRDDGAGFDPSATSYGTGIQGMADRLDAVGGSLRVASVPGAGTTVTGTIPVSTRAAAPRASGASGRAS